MADIALLVAEEFEKRVKRGAPNGGEAAAGDAGERKNFGAVAKVWSSWVESASAAASGVTVNVAVQLRELEPKSGPGLAAVDGLFSA
ncbi:unnamed protein product [Urochloa decumbens]|uniref:Uncharacterized protein n=1 Tax=Urochloa decumbens TaxID=240449 RepID=A0ABC8WNI6_9POAL